jgi:putative transposase
VPIRGELLKLGHRVSAPRDPPCPEGPEDSASAEPAAGTTWRQFPHAQASTMLAVDFFGGDCALTLERLYCLFAIEAGRRHVHIPGGSPRTRTGRSPPGRSGI